MKRNIVRKISIMPNHLIFYKINLEFRCSIDKRIISKIKGQYYIIAYFNNID